MRQTRSTYAALPERSNAQHNRACEDLSVCWKLFNLNAIFVTVTAHKALVLHSLLFTCSFLVCFSVLIKSNSRLNRIVFGSWLLFEMYRQRTCAIRLSKIKFAIRNSRSHAYAICMPAPHIRIAYVFARTFSPAASMAREFIFCSTMWTKLSKHCIRNVRFILYHYCYWWIGGLVDWSVAPTNSSSSTMWLTNMEININGENESYANVIRFHHFLGMLWAKPCRVRHLHAQNMVSNFVHFYFTFAFLVYKSEILLHVNSFKSVSKHWIEEKEMNWFRYGVKIMQSFVISISFLF